MSDDLDALGGSLFNGFIPQMWKRLMPNTQKPLGSWMSHFLERYTQYDLWIAHGEPKVIWLSGLHIPESYLTALVQTTCRALNWPLDKATSSTKVTEYTESAMPPAKLERVPAWKSNSGAARHRRDVVHLTHCLISTQARYVHQRTVPRRRGVGQGKDVS